MAQREIKFRAWDERREKFIDFNDLKFGAHGAYAIVYYDPERGDVVQEMAYLTLQQSTGLHDKNGVEIYEGDVVRTTGSAPHVVMEVQWNNGYAAFGLRDPRLGETSQPIRGLHPTSRLEVIGNIYEHPELLGGEGVAA